MTKYQLTPMNANRSWLATMVRLKIDRRTLYTCRHTHISLLLDSGWSVKAVAERVGHASAKMTLDVYCHTLPETDGKTAAAFERLMQAAGGVPCFSIFSALNVLAYHLGDATGFR